MIDRAEIYVKGGNGGNGVVSFRREKYVPFGGPDGGNGGDGGSVYLVGDESMATLREFRYRNQLKARKGANGKGKDMTGKRGEDLEVKVPLGTQVRMKEEDGSLILKLLPGYVSDSWKQLAPADRKGALRRVLRYYGLLILPIALGLGAVLARGIVLIRRRRAASPATAEDDPGRLVPLLAMWWLFDMLFVWISPRSYEQYYLPLNASGAMLGGYLVGLYAHRLHADRDKTRWVVLGLLGLLLMIGMSWHIFFGVTKSPHSGTVYRNPRTQQPRRTRGYLQKWQEVRSGATYSWQVVGQYMRQHSEPNDTIYIWGWVPGIYVQAQRMSPTPKAFEGMMHTLPPERLAARVREIVGAFEQNPPKFIVDARKDHFPWDRPPLELWPIVSFTGGKNLSFLPLDESMVKAYDAMWMPVLRERYGNEEARRYEALAPLREYVMKNYNVAERQRYRAARSRLGLPTLVHEAFGVHEVFVRK